MIASLTMYLIMQNMLTECESSPKKSACSKQAAVFEEVFLPTTDNPTEKYYFKVMFLLQKQSWLPQLSNDKGLILEVLAFVLFLFIVLI